MSTVWAMGALQVGDLLPRSLWGDIERTVGTQGQQFNFSSAPLFLFGAARMQMPLSGAWRVYVCVLGWGHLRVCVCVD